MGEVHSGSATRAIPRRGLSEAREIVAEELVWNEPISDDAEDVDHGVHRGTETAKCTVEQKIHDLRDRQHGAALREQGLRFQPPIPAELDETFLGEAPMVLRMRMVEPHVGTGHNRPSTGLENPPNLADCIPRLVRVLENLGTKDHVKRRIRKTCFLCSAEVVSSGIARYIEGLDQISLGS